MLKVILLFGVCFVACFTPLLGQKPGGEAYVDLRVDNDVFYLPVKSDQYFTSGLLLEVGWENKARSPLLAAGRARRTRFVRMTQNLFTPQRIESLDLLRDDRPFASYLVATYGNGYTDDHLGVGLSQEFTAGVLGRYSGGGRMQNAFHDMLSFAERLPGWMYEVKPDVVLNYRLGLRRSLRLGRGFWINGDLFARLGSLHTDLAPAFSAEWLALRLGPARTLRLELSGQARLVGYNATLTGGLFNVDDRYRGVIQPRLLVGRAGLDGIIDFDGWRVSGGIRHLSSEFKGGWKHAWAWISFRFQPGWDTLELAR
jgi:hypothetical protein